MADRLDVLTNSSPEIFFQLEEALLSLSEKPLNATYRMEYLLGELVDLLSHDSQHQDLCALSDRLRSQLNQCLTSHRVWSSPSCHLLANWITEIRSQYLLAESFYLPYELGELSRVTSLLVEEIGDTSELNKKRYVGEYRGDLKGFEEGLQALSGIGFWSIESCSNDSDASTESREIASPAIQAHLSLLSTIPLSDVQHQCGTTWKWSLAEVDSDIVPTDAECEEYVHRNTLSYLKRLVIEREAWRHTAGLGRLYTDMESEVSGYAKRIDSFFRFERPLDLKVIPRSYSSRVAEKVNAQALLVYGRVCVLADSSLSSYELAGPLLAVFKVTVAGRALVVPAYMANVYDANRLENDSNVSFDGGSWQESSAIDVLPILDVWRGNNRYVLYADGFERAYGTPVCAEALPANVLNVWSVRGELVEEFCMPDAIDGQILEGAQRPLATNLCHTPISTISERIKLHECVIDGAMTLWLRAGFVYAILPNDSLGCFNDNMLLVDDTLIPVLNPNPLEGRDGIWVVIKAGGVMVAARCQTINQIHLEQMTMLDESVNERFKRWQTGEQKDLRITCEADVFALHRMLLEAL